MGWRRATALLKMDSTFNVGIRESRTCLRTPFPSLLHTLIRIISHLFHSLITHSRLIPDGHHEHYERTSLSHFTSHIMRGTMLGCCASSIVTQLHGEIPIIERWSNLEIVFLLKK
eukprot:scaffold31403_cov154-Skeletonema_menzelii.AAC.3